MSTAVLTIAAVLFIAAFLAWLLSTVAGGGGGMLMIPIVTWVVRPQAVAPAITLGHVIGSPIRIWMFWDHIDWKIVAWYLPGAVAGAIVGGWIFASMEGHAIKIIAALFLLSTIFQYRFGEARRSFPMRAWVFLPVAFVVAMVSGIVGEAGPVLNPFYLNYGTLKEDMIGTKSVNSFLMHLTKMSTYAAFGIMTREFIVYGLAIGAAATLASWVGKLLLKRMDEDRFTQIVIWVMVLTGVLMLWQERATLISFAHHFRALT